MEIAMSHSLSHRGTLVLAALFFATLGAAAAQNVLQQLNVSEADARSVALSSITDGYVQYGVAAKAIKALPAAARGPVIEAAIGWARAYVGSPAFAAEYAALRERQKPEAPEAAGSVDDELKQELAKQQQEIEETKKNVAAMPPETRTEMEAVIKQMEAMAKDPEMHKMMRSSIEGNRAEAKVTYESNLKDWEARYPAEPRLLVAKRLRAFLETSADVDFSAAVIDKNGGKVFADAQYEKRSGDWKVCYRAGKEATAAARTAAEAWLKELQVP
jgi:flagellar biosynthesis GTPase FlhF